MFFSLPSLAMHAAPCLKRALQRGMAYDEVRRSYRTLYGKKGWCYLTKHCRNPQQAQVELKALLKKDNQEKCSLENIRPRPAAAIIPCDNRLMATALLLRLFADTPPGDDSSYEDEDD